MKKAIATLSIILILLNIFIPSSNAVNSQNAVGAKAITDESIDGYMNDGKGKLPTKGSTTSSESLLPLDTTGNNQASLITALLEILIVPPMIVNWLMSIVATNGQSTYTIEDMLLNKYYLFDIDFFNANGDGQTSDDPNKELIDILKENVATWYFTLRNISIIGSALIIIYVAIRLALELTRRGRTRSYC